MEHNAAEKPLHTLVRDERGVIRTAGALLTDASGHRQVSAGSDIFSVVFTHGVFVDLPAAPVWQDACGHYAQGFFLSALHAPIQPPARGSSGCAYGRRTTADGANSRVSIQL